jgi:hypothetical protein
MSTGREIVDFSRLGFCQICGKRWGDHPYRGGTHVFTEITQASLRAMIKSTGTSAAVASRQLPGLRASRS